MNKIPKYLKPFENGDLVYIFENYDCEELLDYIIQDSKGQQICRADSKECAELIAESINMFYKIRKVDEDNGIELGRAMQKESDKQWKKKGY